jgi:very-short-patch-repair endonuclease
MEATRAPLVDAMRLAADQDGAVGVGQLRECGVTARAQRAAERRGQLIAVEPDVCVVFGSPDTWHRRLRVGLLALGPDAFVSHEAAAQLHGLPGFVDERVEFTSLRQRRSRQLNGATVHTTTMVGPHDVLPVNGFRCASATRAILDLAGSRLPEHRVESAIDGAVRLRLSAALVLETRLAAMRNRRGVRLLDRLLIDSGGESELERRFLRLVREHGLPRPITQRRIKRSSGQVARVDFLYAAERLVVEVSGRLGHATDEERRKDAQRRNELQDLGYFVCEYTWGDVTRRPRYVITTLRERLLQRAS